MQTIKQPYTLILLLLCVTIFFVSSAGSDDTQNNPKIGNFEFILDNDGAFVSILSSNKQIPLNIPVVVYQAEIALENWQDTYPGTTEIQLDEYTTYDIAEHDEFREPQQYIITAGINGCTWNYIFEKIPSLHADLGEELMIGLHGWGDTEDNTTLFAPYDSSAPYDDRVNPNIPPYVSLIYTNDGGKIFISPEIELSPVSIYNGSEWVEEMREIVVGPDKWLIVHPSDSMTTMVRQGYTLPTLLIEDSWISQLGDLYDSAALPGYTTGDNGYNWAYHDTGTDNGAELTVWRGWFDDPNKLDYDLLNPISAPISETEAKSIDYENVARSATQTYLYYFNSTITDDLATIYNQIGDNGELNTVDQRMGALYHYYYDHNTVNLETRLSYFYTMDDPWTETAYTYTPEGYISTTTVTRATTNFRDYIVAFTGKEFMDDEVSSIISENCFELAQFSNNAVELDQQELSISTDPGYNLPDDSLERFATLVSFLYEGNYETVEMEDDYHFYDFSWTVKLDADGQPVKDSQNNTVYYANRLVATFDPDNPSEDGFTGNMYSVEEKMEELHADVITGFSQQDWLSVQDWIAVSPVEVFIQFKQQDDGSIEVTDAKESYNVGILVNNKIAQYLGKQPTSLMDPAAVMDPIIYNGLGDPNLLYSYLEYTPDENIQNHYRSITERIPNALVSNILINWQDVYVQVSHTSQVQRIFDNDGYFIDLLNYNHDAGFGFIDLFVWNDNGNMTVEDAEAKLIARFQIHTSVNGCIIDRIVNVDTDQDTLNDYDEIFVYHTNPHSHDTDGDGVDDDDEIDTDTDPLDSSSFFGITGLSCTTNSQGERVIAIQWKSVPGRDYAIYTSSDDFGTFTLLQDNFHADSDTSSFSDTQNANQTIRFYKIILKDTP